MRKPGAPPRRAGPWCWGWSSCLPRSCTACEPGLSFFSHSHFSDLVTVKTGAFRAPAWVDEQAAGRSLIRSTPDHTLPSLTGLSWCLNALPPLCLPYVFVHFFGHGSFLDSKVEDNEGHTLKQREKGDRKGETEEGKGLG